MTFFRPHYDPNHLDDENVRIVYFPAAPAAFFSPSGRPHDDPPGAAPPEAGGRQRPALAGESPDPAGRGGFGESAHLDPERDTGAGPAGADPGPGEAAHHDGVGVTHTTLNPPGAGARSGSATIPRTD